MMTKNGHSVVPIFSLFFEIESIDMKISATSKGDRGILRNVFEVVKK